eukprot:3458151-Pyramimonas_sp.AAC.1
MEAGTEAARAEAGAAEAAAELQARVTMLAVAESFELERRDDLKMKARSARLALNAAVEAEAQSVAVDGLERESVSQ